MEENILDKFFYIREEEISENIKEDTENLKSKLKKVKQEDINNIIEKLPEEYFEIKRELKDKVEDLIINYNIKIAYYNKKYYICAFNDAINLFKIC